MPKEFYTERDIEDLARRGVTSLTVSDNVVVTDLGRERARKLGFELVQPHDQPDSAPVRPYIVKPVAAEKEPAAAPASVPPAAQPDMEQRVTQAVKAKLSDSVDGKLLETIIKRVLQSIGGS
jgi:hypothetical protein